MLLPAEGTKFEVIFFIKKRGQEMKLLFHVVKKIDRSIGEKVFAIHSVFQCLPAVLTPTTILSCLGSIDKDFARSGGS